jgi:ornithine cyclodeaminase
MASLRALGPQHFDRVAILGCGYLALVHLGLIERYFPEVTRLDVYDVRATAAHTIAHSWNRRPGRTATVHEHPRTAVAEAPVLITLTTSDSPYLPAYWLPKEVFVAHVSLDDLAPDALCDAEIFVDDLDLVRDNPRRILGRLLNEGRIVEHPDTDRPGLRGTLGQVLTGAMPALRPDGHRIISNPFGMAILDLALLRVVQQAAVEQDLGVSVDLTHEAPARSVFGPVGKDTP